MKGNRICVVNSMQSHDSRKIFAFLCLLHFFLCSPCCSVEVSLTRWNFPDFGYSLKLRQSVAEIKRRRWLQVDFSALIKRIVSVARVLIAFNISIFTKFCMYHTHHARLYMSSCVCVGPGLIT